MYRVAVGGGSILALDDAFEFSVSPVVGSHLIAYSKTSGATSEIFTFDYISGTSGPITSLGFDVFSPTFSRDGNKVLFVVSQVIGIDSDLYSVPTIGGSSTQVTNTPSLFKSMGFYNEDSSKIAAVMFNGSAVQTIQVITNNGATYTPLVVDDSLQPILYWTDSNGRSVSANIPHYQFGKHRRRGR